MCSGIKQKLLDKIRLCVELVFDNRILGLLPFPTKLASFADDEEHFFKQLRPLVSHRDKIGVLVHGGLEDSWLCGLHQPEWLWGPAGQKALFGEVRCSRSAS